ncbi:SH2 domain-containing protein 2A isoform 1-T1 [Cyanocitta cristata]
MTTIPSSSPSSPSVRTTQPEPSQHPTQPPSSPWGQSSPRDTTTDVAGSLQASGHFRQPSPCLRGTRGQSRWPCVPGRGCGLSRHKPRGWGPRGSSQRGSTASSAGGRQRSCCRISPWAASWSASARAPSASSSPTGEGLSPARGRGRRARSPPARCAHATLSPARGRDRCRHFVLDQLPDGRYVVLGERSAHAELAELLQHYATAPVTPYHEFLTVPLPCGWVRSRPPRAPAALDSFRLRGQGDFPKLGNKAKGSPSITKAGVGTAATLGLPGARSQPAASTRLGLPCPRTHPDTSLLSLQKDEPRGRAQPSAGSDAAHSPLSEAPAKLPDYNPMSLELPRAEGGSGREVMGEREWRHLPRDGSRRWHGAGGRSQSHHGPASSPHLQPVPPLPQAPGAPPSLPAKTSARGAAQGPHSPSSSAAAPEAPYAQVRREAARPEPPEAKYQQLLCFHVYAEPREDIAPSPPEPEEPGPEEPIPFYAMARGWSRRAGPEENIYSEVALARQDPPARLPVAPQNAFSTLPLKPRPHRRLFRSVSSQDCKRRQPSAAPSTDRKDRGASSTGTEVILNPALELDDPVYSQSTHREQQTTAMAENVYEQLPGDCP